MMGVTTPSWQDKELRKIEGLIHREDFKADIATLPIKNTEARFSALLKIIEKYKLLNTSGLILDYYAKTGRLEPNHALSGMSVVCDIDETAGPTRSLNEAKYNYVVERGFKKPGIYIFIPLETSQIDLKSFIESSWKYMESKLTKLNNGKKSRRIRRKPNAQRDAEIMRLHAHGFKNSEIADKISSNENSEDVIGYNDVAKIIERNRDI